MEVRASIDMRLDRNALGQFVNRRAREINREKAKEVVNVFQAIAPIGPGPMHWRNSLSISESGGRIQITSSDPVALIKELGARHGKNPAFRSMLKALEAVCAGGGGARASGASAPSRVR